MGIGTSAFYQAYQKLKKTPLQERSYYSFLIDKMMVGSIIIRWRSMVIDGPVLHRDAEFLDLVHLYLIPYERHLLVAHFEMHMPLEYSEMQVEPLN